MDNLFRVVQYCENITDCRRSQLLHYFGETDFNADDCKTDEHTTCDNCSATDDCSTKDFTIIAKAIVQSVNIIAHEGTWNFRKLSRQPANRLTINQYIDVFMVSYFERIFQMFAARKFCTDEF